MSVVIGKNSFNKVWAVEVGKENFVEHYSKVPGFENINLSKEFDNISPPIKVDSKKKK